MKTAYSYILFFLVLSSVLNAQMSHTWATYFGGNNFENPTRIESDSKGNVYICGASTSTNFPLLSNSTYFQGLGLAVDYAFISKFSPTGKLLWSIPYADTTNYTSTLILDIEIDKNDNVFVCGHSNGTALPLMNYGSYFQTFNGGVQDAYVLKLDSAGNLLWASYFGGDGDDWGNSLCLNVAGDIYLTGVTSSTLFPFLNSGGYYNTLPDPNGTGFVARFSNNGNLLWSSLYQKIKPLNCVIDTSQNLIITGQAFTGFSTQNMSGAFFQPSCAGLDDAAILKFNQNDSLVWSTLFGGTSSDRAYCLVADKFGSFYMLGHTQSSNIPLQNSGGYFKPNLSGSGDIFLARFTNAGILSWSTYYGGSANEAVNTFDNFDIDACGNLYVGIDTYSSDMPYKKTCEGGYLDSTLGGVSDHFISRFNPAQIQQWGSYFGGSGFDNRSCIEVNRNGDVFLAGTWPAVNTTGLPLLNPGSAAYYDSTPNGLNDVGIVKFSNSLLMPTFTYPSPVCNSGGTIGLTNPQLPSQGGFSTSIGLTLDSITGVINPLTSSPGIYTITFSSNQPTTTCNCTLAPHSSATTTIEILIQPSVSVLGSMTVCPNSVASVTAFGANTYYWSNAIQTASAALNPTPNSQYYVIGTFTNSCKDTAFINLVQSLNPDVVIVGNTTICPEAVATLTANGATSYLWSNSAQTSTAAFSPFITTTYQVIGYFPDGCHDTVNVTVYVDFCMSLPHNSLSANILIYQTNNEGELCIKSSEPTEFFLYDILGKELKKVEVSNHNLTTYVYGLTAGIYVLIDQKNLQTYKISVH